MKEANAGRSLRSNLRGEGENGEKKIENDTRDRAAHRPANGRVGKRRVTPAKPAEEEEETVCVPAPVAVWQQRAAVHLSRSSCEQLHVRGCLQQGGSGGGGGGGGEKGKKHVNKQLVAAVIAENLSEVERAVSSGADVNARDALLHTPLHLASATGNFEIVRMLLEARADVRVRGQDGDEPCHIAASQGHMRVLEFLMQHGGCLDSYNNEGMTARHLINISACVISAQDNSMEG